MNVVLYGVKASGKSTVGQALASALAYEYIDTDFVIEQQFENLTQRHLSFAEIYREQGEVNFRQLETQAVTAVADTDKAVIAVGGSTLLNSINVEVLKQQGCFVYLKIGFEQWQRRLQALPQLPHFLEEDADQTVRRTYFKQRANCYAQLADIELGVGNLAVEQVVQRLIERL